MNRKKSFCISFICQQLMELEHLSKARRAEPGNNEGCEQNKALIFLLIHTIINSAESTIFFFPDALASNPGPFSHITLCFFMDSSKCFRGMAGTTPRVTRDLCIFFLIFSFHPLFRKIYTSRLVQATGGTHISTQEMVRWIFMSQRLA